MDKYYSGLIVDSNIIIDLFSDEPIGKAEIKNNFKKIKNLPWDICKKIMEVPQFEIFFENNIPYYITQNDFVKKELPKWNGDGLYYDPVKDTEAYKLIIDDVKELANKEYEEQMIKEFGTKEVFGGVNSYYAIESNVLYEKYGIHCINNPMSLNHGFYID